MTRRRLRTAAALALASALLALPAGPARADQAYDKVAAAFAQAGGQLDPCAFTEDELKAAVRGIPRQIRDVVPDLRAAMVEGIAAHERGDCSGAGATEKKTGGVGASGAETAPPATVPTTTAPAVTTPTETTESEAPPATTTPAPATTAPAQAAGDGEDDLTPLLVALVAAGALALLGLLAWAWARARGWDPAWVARTRHAWGEAGYRTTSTWSEFTDWLRLGR